MNIYLFANTDLKQSTDVYGYTIVDTLDTSESITTCYDYLTDPGHGLIASQVHIVKHIHELIPLCDPTDLIVSLQTVVYESKAGSGLRGYYRSTRYPNSERCKALAITLLKSVHDHSGLYYQGVYNELRDRHPDLTCVVKVKPVAAMIEIGYEVQDPTRHHRIKGIALGRGILRHVNALRTLHPKMEPNTLTSQTESVKQH
jgi:hypothetical protein